MSEGATIAEHINRAPLWPHLAIVHGLSTLVMIIEGIDAFGVGFIGPFLYKQYNVGPEALGFVYTGTVISSLAGAVLLAPLADRFGRRPLLLICCALMGPATLMTALSHSVYVLVATRCLIGLAFGASLPILMAQVGDYAPERCRTFLVMLINYGIGFGAMLSGFLAAVMIPTFGWKSLPYFSGAVSIAFCLMVFFLMPESLEFLMRRDPKSAKAQQILRRITGAQEAVIVIPPAPIQTKARAGSPFELFKDGRLMATSLLWFVMSLTYVSINFDSYWVPTVLMQNGLSLEQTGYFTSIIKLISYPIAFYMAWLADRKGLTGVVVFSFVATGLFELGIAGVAHLPLAALGMLLLSVCASGMTVSGTHAIVVNTYPPELRATSSGWLTGTARLIGGGAGTIIGGFIVGAKLGLAPIALIFGSISLMAGAVVYIQQKTGSARPAPPVLSPIREQPQT